MIIKNAQTFPNLADVVNNIVSLHEKYFVHQLRWGTKFKDEVKEYLEDLLENFQQKRDGFWVVQENDKIIGSIAIDGRQDNPECARLRAFIVDPCYHHHGIGKSLLDQAITFCNASGYKKIELWTFDDLLQAKNLYLAYGFSIVKERDVVYWGCQLREQLLRLELPQKLNTLTNCSTTT